MDLIILFPSYDPKILFLFSYLWNNIKQIIISNQLILFPRECLIFFKKNGSRKISDSRVDWIIIWNLGTYWKASESLEGHSTLQKS